MIRVGLLNVKYSPNLGDGLLSECLEAELKRNISDVAIESFDLAGRTDYGPGSRFRGAALKILQKTPTKMRQKIAQDTLNRAMRRIAPAWQDRLSEIDAVVTGGGNLFSDADLNFPIKIDMAWRLLREASIPIAVFGVGVSDNWSENGRRLFQRAFSGNRFLDVSVRDLHSAEIWIRQLGHLAVPHPKIVNDPGLLISLHVPREFISPSTPRIGLGLTHPTTVRYHSDEQPVSYSRLTSWYVELVRGLLAQGWHVCVFTNGSSEDEAYLRKVGPALVAVSNDRRLSQVTLAERFTKPAELASYISGLDLLLAHRLHANIAAYSYGVPQIGFSWDVKLKSFFTAVNRERYIVAAGLEKIPAVLDLCQCCLRENIDPSRHKDVLDAARADIRRLAEILSANHASKTCRSSKLF